MAKMAVSLESVFMEPPCLLQRIVVRAHPAGERKPTNRPMGGMNGADSGMNRSYDRHMATLPAAVFQLPAVAALRRGLGHFATALGISSAVAFMLSVQYLVQPWIWRNWPVDEVLVGWLYVLRDRLIVATLVALGVVLADSLAVRPPWLRTVALALGILLGALGGELAVQALSDFDHSSVVPWTVRSTLLSFAAAATLHLWRSSRDTREALGQESLRQFSIEQQLLHTRLSALRSQIEPHFLFNSLATIRHLQGTDPAAGSQLLANFVDYLRRVLPMTEHGEVRLAEEIALIRRYLAIMSVRMSGRLQVHIDAPAALDELAVPPLALATLVENAIKHGLTPSPHGGRLEIRAAVVNGNLRLDVFDDGVGLGTGSSGSGIGLSNVRARLATLYGMRGALQVAALPAGGVHAQLRLPSRRLGLAT
jgi:signal transduction histidine kinase